MRQLPVFGVVGHAVNSTLKNFPLLVKMSWPWMLVLAPVVLATNLYSLSTGNGLQRPPRFGSHDVFQHYVTIAPMLLVQLLAYSSLAVNWHRYILLDEVPSGWSRLRLDRRVRRYVLNIIGIALTTGLVTFVGLIGYKFLSSILWGLFGNAAGIVTTPVLICGVFLLIAFSYRLSLTLPAKAVLGEYQSFTFSEALNETSGNSWRIFGVVLLLMVLSAIVGALGFAATTIFAHFGTVGLSISFGAQVIVQWISTMVGIAILTSMYGFFVEGRNF